MQTHTRSPLLASLRAGLALSGLVLAAVVALPARAETLGEVSTVFKLIGPNHKIVIEAYDDPLVEGVTCFVSRAKTGGITGAVGLATDKSDASIACRQVGEIKIKQPLPQQEDVFSERLSILFKRLRIVRVVDAKRQSLVYMTYSEKLIEGSPKNSITAVPVGKPIPVK
ncbi:CreA family protein [Sphaerotilus montanus]|uniref:CreA protein n=1 Tax=Sphaerotilus montanus TaxID=522889 RepID=A0A7Y9QZW3_9BURK|nr:CreA family protein [Sphaerotilus montanus]NYG34600.1 CreA protein [Sphaerotilus montanus]NZD58837.1 CreA family protein [Sphaerotilus montanus]